MRGKDLILCCVLALSLGACGRGAPQGNRAAGSANNTAATANTNVSAADAQAALASGKLDADIAQLEAQAEKNPEDDAARAALAAAYIRRGDALRTAQRLDEALRDYQSAQRIDPDNEEAQLRLEQLNQESGAEPRGDDGKPVTVPAKKP
jgi:tetratricopeptide (TPR) repeat protein